MMGSDQWFKHFERVLTEHPDISDDEASEMAEERVRDENADHADYAMEALNGRSEARRQVE